MAKYLIDTKSQLGNPIVDFDTLNEARKFAIFLIGMKSNLVSVPIKSSETGKRVGMVHYADNRIGASWIYKNYLNGAEYLLNRDGSTKSPSQTNKRALESLFA